MERSPHLTWIEIDLDAIQHNTRVVKSVSGVDVMAVVKAEAYGFGGVQVGKAAVKAGAAWLAVVRGHEALDLRRAGITAPILVMGGTTPAELDTIIAKDIALPLFDFEWIPLFSERAKAVGKPLHVHLKIDTGMGRFGVFPEHALELARAAQAAGGLEIEGVFSHFAKVDDHADPTTDLQISRFKPVVETLRSNGFPTILAHLSSSTGVMAYPDAVFNMVRVGSGVLGVGNAAGGMDYGDQLKHAFTWKAQLMSCRRFPAGWKIGYGQDYTTSEGEIIGVLPVGHGDGFLRHPKNVVLINGKRTPVVGKVCLDQLMVSLPEMMPLGTEVVLIGKQGDEEIEIEEASTRWSAPQSFVSCVSARVPRVYLPEPL